MSNHTERLPEFGTIPTSFIDILTWRAEHEPDRIAYVFLADGETIEISVTYAELNRQAQAIASMLGENHSVGQRCLLIYPPGLEFLTAFFGCLYAGVVAVPVYPPRKDKDMVRILAVIKHSGTSSIMTISSIKDRFNKIKMGIPTPELDQLQWLVSDQTEELRQFADKWIHPRVSSDNLAFLQYTSGSTGLPKGVMISHRNLIYNQRMMAAATTHTKECVQVTWLPLYHDMGLIGSILHALYVGTKSYFMSPEAFLQKPFRWLHAISRYKATTAGGAPNFAFEHCIHRVTPEQREQLDLSSWKFTLVGSDTVHHKTLERFVEVFGPYGFKRETFFPAYGLAEATVIVSGGSREAEPVYFAVDSESLKYHKVAPAKSDSKQQILVGCGQALLDQKIKIVDPYSLRECAPDRIGEIWVSGENVSQGYWDNEEQTKKMLKARLEGNQDDFFLRTGDLGFLREEELYITGRVKNLIVIRGRNHYPHDIETTVEDSVKALRAGCSAAFTIEKDNEEKLVIVAELERRFFSERRRIGAGKLVADSRNKSDRREFNEDDRGISQPDSDLILEECIDSIRQSVAENHGLQTHAIVLIRPVSLPKTTSGKIRRLDCREQFLEGKLIVIKDWIDLPADTPEETPIPEKPLYNSEAIQSWLLSRLAGELKMARHQINPGVELFRYGLDSLASIGISGELEEWLGKPVSPTVFYNYPSIQAISSYLSGDSQAVALMETDRSEQNRLDTPIAIIGTACRFPGANSPEAFWELLQNSVDAISEVPPERWDIQSYFDPDHRKPGKMNTRWGGFLDDVDLFDPFFFGISPREATFMDPQQRILLEVSWEAFENSGINIEHLAGSKTGVFVGISNNEYSRMTLASPNELNSYQGTGNALSIASNRISYQFDLRGPSISVDTACSSSLVSVHMACQSLRTKESTLALAGGINLILTPEPTVIFSQADMMAADGRCKTFDSSADGYVRGEGCGLVILKLLPDAIRDGDEVLAVIKGSAVNQDGRSNGITAPNGLSQQIVISQALKNAKVDSSQIGYIETHGTGTSLGDPIEMESLKAVLMQNRSQDKPCLIGSVKTNIGHLESASGIAGLLKAALAVQHGQIPGNLHFKTLNPHISLEDTSFSIPVTSQPWPKGNKKRIAGISSFGFGGTNAHLVLESIDQTAESANLGFPAHIFTLSTKTEKALKQLVNQHIAHLEDTSGEENLTRLCFSTNQGRADFEHRLALISKTSQQLKEQLKNYLEIHHDIQTEKSPKHRDQAPRIVFIFPDQKSCFKNMGESLYQFHPTFKKWINQCNDLTNPIINYSLTSLLYGDNSNNSKQSEYSQLKTFAVEFCLAKLWISWGIVPDLLVGSGIGEIVAAVLADVFSLETGLKLVIERDLKNKESENTTDTIKIENDFADFFVLPPTIPIVSGQGNLNQMENESLKVTFWLERIGEDISQVLKNLENEGYRFGVVIGQTLSADNAAQIDRLESFLCLPSLAEDFEDWQHVLETLGQFYERGINIDWRGFYSEFQYPQRLNIPNYPFQRKRYWIEEAKQASNLELKKTQNRYDINWKSLELPSSENLFDPNDKKAGYWLIFEDEKGVGAQLVQGLSKSNSNCISISPGQDYLQKKPEHVELDPTNPSHFDRLLTDTGSKFGSCLGVVHLWSLNGNHEATPTTESLESTISLGSFSVLYLVQAMSRINQIPTRGIWLVTSNTQNVDPEVHPTVSIGQWPLWGLGKGIALEFPDIKVSLVDLPTTAPREGASFLLQETTAPPKEWQVAFRNNQRYVARISTVGLSESSRQNEFRFREDGTYLITGGLGKLGLEVAQFLVKQGVRHLALIGRTKLSEPTDKTVDQHHAWNIIQSLKNQGVTIKTYQADVSELSQIKRIFKKISSTKAPIKGIFHVAGIVSKHTITGISEQEFSDVLKAKVAGTWLLHELTLPLGLDCFVLFSSISSIWGSREISHYAAANAFLDGFAIYRKSLNLPVLSVNWGPWEKGGMTTSEEQTQMSRIGMNPLSPEFALEIMYDLLNNGMNSQIVASVDWARFKPLYESIGYGSLFEEILVKKDGRRCEEKKPKTAKPAIQGTWLTKLISLVEKEKTSVLFELLKKEIAKIMRCQPSDINSDAGFFDLGLDSLMAVELKDILEQELNLVLDATLVFDYPNLRSLTQYLVSRIDQIETDSPESISEPEDLIGNQLKEKSSPDIEDLTDAEIAKLIDQEIEDI